jgi:hypothetical protein
MIPVADAPRLAVEDLRDVLFVIDTLHAKPGSSGRLWIRNVTLER